MPSFTDNFNRADGPLGTNWSVRVGSCSIASNACIGTQGSICCCGPVSGVGAATAEAVVSITSNANNLAMPAVKVSANGAARYTGRVWTSGSNTAFEIRYNTGGGEITGASYTLNNQTFNSGTLRLTYTSGVLTLYFNGTLYITWSNSTLAANTGIGLLYWGSGATADNFLAMGDGAPALYINPHVVGTLDGDQMLAFYGTGVTWTTGTPGSPVLSVGQGAISGQQITTTSNGVFVFTPPATPQVVTVTDSVDGITATINVVSGQYLGQGGGSDNFLPSDVLTWLQQQAAHGGLVLSEQQTGGENQTEGVYVKGAFGELLLGKRVSVGHPSSEPATPIEYLLWDILNGSLTPSQVTNLFQLASLTHSDTQDLLTRTDLAKSGGSYAIGTLMREIAGFPGGNIQDVLTAINALGVPDLSSVLTAISGVRGSGSPDLRTVADLLEGLRTTHNYTLDDVKNWVGTPSQVPTAATAIAVVALVAALLAAAPTGGASVAAAAVAVGAGPVLDIATIVELVSVAGEIAGIVSDIATIKSNLSTPSGINSPLIDVSLTLTEGTPIDFTEPFVYSGACHGVRYTIGTHARGVKGYPIENYTALTGAGTVGFIDDDGYVEPYQYLNWNKGHVVPKTMTKAAGFVFSSNISLSGVATPFTLASST